MPRKRLGELLVSAGLITQEDLDRALAEQKKHPGVNLGRLLVDMGLVEEMDLARALSLQLNLPLVDLDKVDIPKSALQKVDADFCAEHHLIPFNWDSKGRFLDVAMTEPLNLDVLDTVRVKTQCNIRPHLTTYSALARAMLRYHGLPLSGSSDLGYASGLSFDSGDAFERAMLASGPIREFGPSTIEAAVRSSPARPRDPTPAHRPPQLDQIAPHELGSLRGDIQTLESKVSTLAQRVEGLAGLFDQVSKLQGVTDQLRGALQDVLAELKALGELSQRLSARADRIEAYQERDERVLRGILSLLVEKGVCTTEELNRMLSK